MEGNVLVKKGYTSTHTHAMRRKKEEKRRKQAEQVERENGLRNPYSVSVLVNYLR